MKVTYNWLKDFVEIKISPQALADKLTLAGLEVTSLQEKEGDFVLEIEVTSNRPDCLSVTGIAREVSAILGHRLKEIGNRLSKKFLRPTTYDLRPFSIRVKDKNDCPLYTAKIIRGVKVGPSPDWLKRRLELVGCRSINNIVDITNYILFEQGQPLHTFDLDKLSDDTIVIRRARQDEKITTIDGQSRMLNHEILIIADMERPQALAGIMGGKESEVKEGTRNILLEAAVFNPLIVRRARRNLRLESESAYRFERGLDLDRLTYASSQATKLIQEIAGGECVLAKVLGLTKTKKRKLDLAVSTVSQILGVSINGSKIKTILNNLGFKVSTKVRHKNWRTRQALWRAKNSLSVEIPSYRQDVNLEIDLIEEIARIHGYEHIPKTLPKVIAQITVSHARDTVSLLKNILVGQGLNEVITYSLINRDSLRGLEIEGDSCAMEILNPLSKEQEILRPTIIPSLLRCIANNLNQKQSHINIFEIAKVFSVTSGKPREELVLGIALCGIRPLFAFEQDLGKIETGFLHLKGILDVLFERLGIKDYSFKSADSVLEVEVEKEKIGLIAGLEKNILEHFDIKNKDVFVAELSLDGLLSYANLKKRFSTQPAYPGISRDISFILKEDIKTGDILGAIREKGRPLLRDLKVVDYYKGKQIPAGFKGLTISCLYQSDERTLTEAEINPQHSLICAFLTERFNVKIRS